MMMRCCVRLLVAFCMLLVIISSQILFMTLQPAAGSDEPLFLSKQAEENVKKLERETGQHALSAKLTSASVSCPEYGVISVSDRGRLGNLMSQYATLYAFSKLFGRRAVISKHMRDTLSQVFPSISIPAMTCQSSSYNWTIANVHDMKRFTTNDTAAESTFNLFIGDFPVELPVFDAYHHSLSLDSDFKMDPDLETAAKQFLQKIAKRFQHKNATLVAVHARRMDYSIWLKHKVNGRLLSKQYFNAAMNDFRRKHTNPIFVVSSDDKEWIQEMFQNMTDVVLTPRYQTRKHGELDMAILAQCNHSIISFGTFSFWSAYLRLSGDVIVADGYYETQPLLLTYIKKTLPQWRLLKDPCYELRIPGKPPKLTKECEHKRLEYGIFDS